jgi:hypothetical protein
VSRPDVGSERSHGCFSRHLDPDAQMKSGPIRIEQVSFPKIPSGLDSHREAGRILRRLEFHYTPKHASWLKMVEIEIGVQRGRLDRRIDSKEQLEAEIAAWERQRNASGARIKWMFTTEKARAKMRRPTHSPLPYARAKPKSQNHCAAIQLATAGRSCGIETGSGKVEDAPFLDVRLCADRDRA